MKVKFKTLICLLIVAFAATNEIKTLADPQSESKQEVKVSPLALVEQVIQRFECEITIVDSDSTYSGLLLSGGKIKFDDFSFLDKKAFILSRIIRMEEKFIILKRGFAGLKDHPTLDKAEMNRLSLKIEDLLKDLNKRHTEFVARAILESKTEEDKKFLLLYQMNLTQY